jgi:hypothetical protein
MKDLYTTNEQILGAAYDSHRNLLTFSVGREAAKLVIIDIAHPNHWQWVPEAGIPPFYPPSLYREKGLLAYSIDKRTHQELVVRSIETLEELNRTRIPGFGSMEWVDESHLFVVILDDGWLSPRIVNLRNGEWSAPLADVSALFSTVTKDGPVWVANSFFQPPFLQALRNSVVVNFIAPRSIVQNIRVENHHYQSFDGRRLHGWLLRNQTLRLRWSCIFMGVPQQLKEIGGTPRFRPWQSPASTFSLPTSGAVMDLGWSLET